MAREIISNKCVTIINIHSTIMCILFGRIYTWALNFHQLFVCFGQPKGLGSFIVVVGTFLHQVKVMTIRQTP